MQPSKEWVLPARAKPGRKPSETEPLTKRKAQNRASQRAFRERKQSYLADLEAKVAAYEAAEIDRSVEIQKVAQKLRAENESLRKELGSWKEKYAQIERFLFQARANGGKLPGVTPSAKSGPGCKAPAHERAAVAPPKRGVLVPPGAKSAKDKDKAASSVRFADPVSPKIDSKAPSSTEHPQEAVSVPLRRRPSTSSVTPSPVDTSLPPATAAVAVSASETLAQPAQTPLAGPRKGSKPPLWSFETPKTPSPTSPSTTLSTSAVVTDKSSSLLSPSLLPHGGHLSVEGGCGFCTEASPCVCADDFLDLSSQSQPSHIAVASDVPSALPLPKRATASAASETSRRMSIGSLTHANDVALDQRRRNTTKLWYTVTQPEPQSPPLPRPATDAATTSVPLSLKASTKAKGGKKLWAITSAPAEPVCTGDPSTCGACSTDPGLAAFCEAVTTATTATPSSSSSAAATRQPLTRPGMLRSGTTGQLPSFSGHSSNGETIPSAWRQIRSHPRFSQWQGGLDLLAEVVSKRSGNVHSPLLPHASAKRPREESVEIETPHSTTSTSLATSNDRTTAKPILLHTASDTSIHAVGRVKIEEEDGVEAREQKRRRIVIDREAVQEALALLDAGTAAQPRASVGLGVSAKDEMPCPCPWRPGEKRSP